MHIKYKSSFWMFIIPFHQLFLLLLLLNQLFFSSIRLIPMEHHYLSLWPLLKLTVSVLLLILTSQWLILEHSFFFLAISPVSISFSGLPPPLFVLSTRAKHNVLSRKNNTLRQFFHIMYCL